MNIEWRKWISKFITIIILVFLVFGLYQLGHKPIYSGLYVRFLDVGQGDSELIQNSAGQNVLIDGGPDSSVISKLDSFIPFYKREISAIILTHPHADHIDGLNDVLKKYKVDHIYFSGVTYTTDDYLEFLDLAKNKNIPTTTVKLGDQLDLGEGARLDFIFPGTSIIGTKAENVNNTSVVTRLVYGSQSALFMGDLESEGQEELLKYHEIEKSTIYKAPHHGSKDSLNKNFYSLVNPKYVIIEVGKDNKFGHPSATALALYSAANILRTDLEGTISFQIGKESVGRIK